MTYQGVPLGDYLQGWKTHSIGFHSFQFHTFPSLTMQHFIKCHQKIVWVGRCSSWQEKEEDPFGNYFKILLMVTYSYLSIYISNALFPNENFPQEVDHGMNITSFNCSVISSQGTLSLAYHFTLLRVSFNRFQHHLTPLLQSYPHIFFTKSFSSCFRTSHSTIVHPFNHSMVQILWCHSYTITFHMLSLHSTSHPSYKIFPLHFFVIAVLHL